MCWWAPQGWGRNRMSNAGHGTRASLPHRQLGTAGQETR